jgi:ketosteroid isomerase-like protein
MEPRSSVEQVAKVGDSDDLRRITLRVTMIYRREDNGWKIVLRQADPIMTPQPIDSIIATASSASDGH